MGESPTVAVGERFSGTAALTAQPSETGVSLSFVLPIGPTGPQGNRGPGEQGIQGKKRRHRPTGTCGSNAHRYRWDSFQRGSRGRDGGRRRDRSLTEFCPSCGAHRPQGPTGATPAVAVGDRLFRQ